MKDLIRVLHQRWPRGVPIDDYVDFIEALLDGFFDYAGTPDGEWVRKRIYTIDEFIKNSDPNRKIEGAPNVNTGRITNAKHRELVERASGQKAETIQDAERANVSLHKVGKTTPSIKPTAKQQFAETFNDTMKRIKINPNMAQIIKNGFEVHENDDGSLELVPTVKKPKIEEYEEPEVIEDDEPIAEGEERISFDERRPGIRSQADLEVKALEDAKRRASERKGG